MSKKITILGTGCPKCKQLEKLVGDFTAEHGIAAEISKETDIVKIMGYGVMSTPGLVVDGKVVMSGRLPSRDELKKLIG
jgi:small redox-active disulfide protein 2